MELKTSFKYPEWAKMPKNYDFQTKSKDWSEYWSNFILRTDAVWEKYKLLDYFRCYYKVFEFDKEENKYVMYMPRESNLALWYPHDKEEPHVDFIGFTPTGMTGAFKMKGSMQHSIETSAMTGFGREDAYEMCAYRFDICNEKAKLAYDNKEYPCYKIFYEMQYSCSDHMLDYLLQLAAHRKIIKFRYTNISNNI